MHAWSHVLLGDSCLVPVPFRGGWTRGGRYTSGWIYSGGSRISPRWGRLTLQHTILPNFPQNCMEFKEFGLPGGRTSLAPPLHLPLVYLPSPPPHSRHGTRVRLASGRYASYWNALLFVLLSKLFVFVISFC